MDAVAKTVRLPLDVAERLRVLAFTRRKPQSVMVVEALRRYLDAEEAPDGS